MELALLSAVAFDLPSAMAGFGDITLGPTPTLVLPLGAFQVSLSVPGPTGFVRLRVLDGPSFLWLDIPPPCLGVGRALGQALVAVVRSPAGPRLSWEVSATPALSILGVLGDPSSCGVRFRYGRWHTGFAIEGGAIRLWFGRLF